MSPSAVRAETEPAALKSICSTPPSITGTSTKEQPSVAAWGQSWLYSSVFVFLNTPLTLRAVLERLTALETQQKSGPVHGANTVLLAHWKGIDCLCLLFSVHSCSGTELFTHKTQTADTQEWPKHTCTYMICHKHAFMQSAGQKRGAPSVSDLNLTLRWPQADRRGSGCVPSYTRNTRGLLIEAQGKYVQHFHSQKGEKVFQSTLSKSTFMQERI